MLASKSMRRTCHWFETQKKGRQFAVQQSSGSSPEGINLLVLCGVLSVIGRSFLFVWYR